MLNFVSIILIAIILIFVLLFKRKSIIRKFINTRNDLLIESQNVHDKTNSSINLISKNKYKNHSQIDQSFNKLNLRKEMFTLFKGNKKDKIRSLQIAAELSDKSTLKLLKIGLKDMDSDIVKISAKLISKFK